MASVRIGQRYLLLDIETIHPIPSLHISPTLSGMAVLVRRNRRPVHFWMEAFSNGFVITGQQLERKICEKSGTALLRACVRDEIKPYIRIDQPPFVTVVICTRDRTERLERCLKSVLAIEPEFCGVPVPMEIIVVDNAPSTTDTELLMKSYPGVRYVVEPIPGLDFARNRALKEAQGDLLAYVDDDVVADSGWLIGLIEAWAAHPDAAAFTGQVLAYELATKAQILFEQRGGFRRGFDVIQYGEELDGHRAYPCSAGVFGTGANMAFQKHILENLGGFDEALDTGSHLPAAGDHDIFYRLIRANGPIVYSPDCLVFHEHRRDIKSLVRQYWSWGLGVMTFVDKCWRTDPTQRPKLRYLVVKWFTEHSREFISAFSIRTSVPFYMILAEMAGGAIGLMGGYARSVRHAKRVRRLFPSLPNAFRKGHPKAVSAERTWDTKTDPTRPASRPPISQFKPWKILHLDLSKEAHSLSFVSETGGLFVVFWWHDIPLGHLWISIASLPMSAVELTERALTAIFPAVEGHLLGRAVGGSTPGRSDEDCQMDPKTLAELGRPLHRLHEKLSFPTAGAVGTSISVVICTRDRPEQLQRCLLSLRGLHKKPHEILVVDNASRCRETQRVVSRFPEAGYIREPRPGLDIARNSGLSQTCGEIVAFTDDDAVAHPDWIERIYQGFKDPNVMAVTGLVLPAEMETEAQFRFERDWGFGRGYAPKVFGSRYFERVRPLGAPVWEIGAGANMAFRRKIFDSVGLFDERLDVGAAGCSGDSEMWYRILAQGWTCRYEPTSVVYHYHRRTIEELHQQIYYYMRGHVAALLIQFERHRHWGNIRRLLMSLPRYYGGLAVQGLLNGFSGRHKTLPVEIHGCLSGIRFYLSSRHADIALAKTKDYFRQGTCVDQ